jgi:hypothetical protein
MPSTDRQENKNQEHEILAKEALAHPELFERRTYVEDSSLLREFGIDILASSRLLRDTSSSGQETSS